MSRSLVEACKLLGIEKEWIGDSQPHTWVCASNMNKMDNSEISILCENYMIEVNDDGKNGVSFYGLYPKLFSDETDLNNLYAKWEWSEINGMILHKDVCTGECKCVAIS